jgi:hypothetical protein
MLPARPKNTDTAVAFRTARLPKTAIARTYTRIAPFHDRMIREIRRIRVHPCAFAG